MKHPLLTLAVVVVAGALVVSAIQLSDISPGPERQTEESGTFIPPIAPVGATLLDGLGNYSRKITTDSEEAQRWFDQALMLTWGFNHQAAERSFLQAISVDPECAMCWWGAALVLGPHVNAGMDPANNAAAWERLQRARSLAGSAEPWEQAWIDALGARYAENPGGDRTALDRAYADAMKRIVATYPDDLDAATFYGEALMNLQPWNYWTPEGAPVGETLHIVDVLEGVIERNPDHAGALHLYIHAVEASNEPERGVAAADRLRTLIPGSGHLVHMPAHIYARVGRWHDAVIANRRAIEADDAYLAACRPGPGIYPLGYVPHNHHFLWFAATMAGEQDVAMEAAASTRERTSDPDLMRTPGFEPMQNFALTPLFARVRFGRWEELLEMPKPADDLPYMVAMWDYGRGIAALRTGDVDTATSHHARLVEFANSPTIEAMTAWDRYSLIHGVRIAERTLAAELAWHAGELDAATDAMNKAIAIEDELPYDEPPAWHHPGRLVLGAILLDADRPAEAENAYRAELKRNPENGWSLKGLEQSLAAQERDDEARTAAERFERAWAHADFELVSTRL
ncbi:tetratricopeptide repeat protein [Lentisalinibacter orientalis]|uniref:tetratricopeptide repeat protein n=1 Tax=Lentisalinibacter orientalis TaxID=2992241 RepID=UPI00386B08EE